jgi:cell division protein YceG involved in septum cleavage
MNADEKEQLQKMIAANDTQDHTEILREIKHSTQIYNDVSTMIKLKRDYARLAKSNPKQFDAMCVSRCAFLFKYYTDIYNRLKSGEIDLNLLFKMINILRDIEDGKLDQHEGSFEVGKILKKIYVDSALKRSENLDAEHAAKEKRAAATKSAKTSRPAIPEKKLTWAEYKAREAAQAAAAATPTPQQSSSPADAPDS